ncbi:hypothetical protein MKZ38_001909 [Zalerion maritima]|uniref:Uncharacterized protein n=1 Tax=Zalerion maritima TaxID=339359 RepID=A0AAD5RPN3_9PEZI|nr:hypothetical protein MKZ38_001909 [Zalerion maritima]
MVNTSQSKHVVKWNYGSDAMEKRPPSRPRSMDAMTVQTTQAFNGLGSTDCPTNPAAGKSASRGRPWHSSGMKPHTIHDTSSIDLTPRGWAAPRAAD